VRLDPTPTTLTCSVCGATVDDAGYLPATEHGDGYRPTPDDAVCGACGFNEMGMGGCAPELADVTDEDDVLLYVERTDDAFEVVSAKR